MANVPGGVVRGTVAILLALSMSCLSLEANQAHASSTSSTSPMTPLSLARVPDTSIVYLMGYVSCGSKLCVRLA